MLDGLNALIQCFKLMWNAFFNAPVYGDLTWGFFLISVAVIGILLTFFISKLK